MIQEKKNGTFNRYAYMFVDVTFFVKTYSKLGFYKFEMGIDVSTPINYQFISTTSMKDVIVNVSSLLDGM